MKIYSPQITNDHQFLVAKEDAALSAELNQRSMAGRWKVPEFELQSFQIFSISRLVIDDVGLADSELFVLDGSNRTALFAFPDFVDRVTQPGLEGVDFKVIGELRG